MAKKTKKELLEEKKAKAEATRARRKALREELKNTFKGKSIEELKEVGLVLKALIREKAKDSQWLDVLSLRDAVAAGHLPAHMKPRDSLVEKAEVALGLKKPTVKKKTTKKTK